MNNWLKPNAHAGLQTGFIVIGLIEFEYIEIISEHISIIHIMCCIELCTYLQYKLSITHDTQYTHSLTSTVKNMDHRNLSCSW